MPLLAPARTDCSSWMCFVGAWGCSAASKGRTILQDSHFLRLVPKFPQLGTSRVPQFPADLQEGLSHGAWNTVYPSTGDSHMICGACGVCTAPGQGWIPGTAASPSEELRGPMPRWSDSRVVCISIRHSPAEEILCSFAEPAKLWCQHIFLLWSITTGVTNHHWQIFCSSLEHSACGNGTVPAGSAPPVLSRFAVGRSVAVGFAGSFPHPSPSWSKAVGVFPKYCSAGFCRIGHTEPRQMN